MGKEVRAHGLNVALSSSREGANSLEVLLGTPARRQGGEGNVDNLNRSHCKESVMGMVPGRVWEEQLGFFACLFFLPQLAARQSKDEGSRHASCNVLRSTASDLVINASDLNFGEFYSPSKCPPPVFPLSAPTGKFFALPESHLEVGCDPSSRIWYSVKMILTYRT